MTHGEVNGNSLCPVTALVRLQKTFPERAPGGREQDLPFFRWTNGEPVKRSYIREILGLAAVRNGLPRSRVGVRSLRVGGATALWVGTQGNATLVRRLGRWASDAVHSYLWDLPVLTEGTTQAMVSADTTVPWGAVRKRLDKDEGRLEDTEGVEDFGRAGAGRDCYA